MKLREIVEQEIDLSIDEGFILEIEDSELVENLINDLELLEARNIATTTGENLIFVKSLKALRTKAVNLIKAGMKKNPQKTAPLIAKVRYLTGRGSGDERIKNAAKGIYKGGKPVEDNVYNLNKADIELIKANEEDGTSKKSELKANQIRYKKSQEAGDYRVLTTTNLFALKVGDKVYTVKSAEDKIEKYADAAAKVVVEARSKTARIAKRFKLKVPYIPKSEKEARDYIIDLLIKPSSKAAKASKAKAKLMNDRKMDAKKEGTKLPKNDYAISIDSYRHGKVVVIVQLHLDKVVDALGYESIKASEVPDSWTDSTAAWKRKAKEYKTEMKEQIETLAGSNASVSIGNTGGWITIRFTN